MSLSSCSYGVLVFLSPSRQLLFRSVFVATSGLYETMHRDTDCKWHQGSQYKRQPSHNYRFSRREQQSSRENICSFLLPDRERGKKTLYSTGERVSKAEWPPSSQRAIISSIEMCIEIDTRDLLIPRNNKISSFPPSPYVRVSTTPGTVFPTVSPLPPPAPSPPHGRNDIPQPPLRLW